MPLRTNIISEPSSAINNITLDTSGNVTSGGTVVMSSPYTMRNKIINGAMVIDQRNAGASVSVSTTGVFPVDRIVCNASGGGVYSAQRSSVAPTGFSNSLLMTVTTNRATVGATEFYGFQHNIEGFNVADLAFGTSGAQTVTVSFWVRSSLTGIASFRLTNNTLNRTYVTTYTVNAANTWEYKTVTIPGDTSGTWTTDNTKGLEIFFNLTSGSNFLTSSINQWITTNTHGSTTQTLDVIKTSGATFQITGLQIERGTVATPFEYRNYQQELAMCQRYYQQQLNSASRWLPTMYQESLYLYGVIPLQTYMRTVPSTSIPATSAFDIWGVGAPTAIIADSATSERVVVRFTKSGLTNYYAYILSGNGTTYFTFSAEL